MPQFRMTSQVSGGIWTTGVIFVSAQPVPLTYTGYGILPGEWQLSVA